MYMDMADELIGSITDLGLHVSIPVYTHVSSTFLSVSNELTLYQTRTGGVLVAVPSAAV